ncbi:vegetative incompatibility protein HET-E-1 [Penicillium malachiteum]|nr:vegetative incompatibility protein HET-E-1 [Penicillium malachiteum]
MAARSAETHDNLNPYINVQSVSASNDANIQIGFMSHERDSLETSLANLPVASEAAFNSKNNQSETLCLSTTRSELLDDISAWIEHDNEKKVFWLTGMAGTGKSTVARTVARKYYDRGQLGGSFFFSRGGGDLNSSNKLFTTLAWQLAIKIPSTKRHVCEAVRANEDIITLSLHDQWERLIINSLSQMNSQTSPTTILFIIDALDECDSEGDIRIILKVLTTSKLTAKIRLKIFITSRPHVAIRGGFQKTESEELALHEIPSALVDRDLQIYFESKLSEIREERDIAIGWPGRKTIKRLVEIAYGLFIWASTACRFIRDGKGFATKRLQKLINGHRVAKGPEERLDQIYTTVLEESIDQGNHDDDEREELYSMLRKVLGSIMILCDPLSMESLSSLLGDDIPLQDIKGTLADLHTVLNIPKSMDQQIRLHHPTFRDFLLDKDRCSDVKLWIDSTLAHKEFAERCVDLMSKNLRKNISGLKSSGTFVKDIEPSQIKQYIPPDLQYACLYWVSHCQQGAIHLQDDDEFHRFFQESFLYWLEAVNLMGKGDEAGAIIRLYHALLKIFQPADNKRQLPFAKDARRFIFKFQNIIKQAPLQVYCAALAFVQPTNELKNHFWPLMKPWIGDLRIAEANVPKPKDEFNYVSDLAFTPDSTRIASGSNFQAVRFWDIETKSQICKFEGSIDKMSSVAISPDGKLLAAGSDDFTVMIWELEKRTLLASIQAHSGWVNSVIFSPDGRILASGSMDETVAFWDIETGQEMGRISNQCSCVNSATFSPDGRIMATGSVDNLVRLWKVSTATQDIQNTLDGHSGCINSVRFSPDGQSVLTGSDDMTVRLWQTSTGEERRLFRGHTKKVMAVAFSLDASLVVSGSEDKTVRICDARSGNILHIIEVHRSGINSVLFSPNNRILASSSFDDEVRLWDTSNWNSLGKLEDFEEDVNSGTLATQRPFFKDWPQVVAKFQSLKAHSSAVTCIAVSDNGEFFASGSHDTTIKLWKSGAEIWTFKGHTNSVNDLSFSTDGCLIASASGDCTIRLWNTDTGEPSHVLEGHSENVTLVRFSRDNSLVFSCSTDTTIRVWSSDTGMPLYTLEDHSTPVVGLQLSPDNCYAVCWSADNNSLLWNTQTQKSIVLRGHSSIINSVAFSPRGDILVSSSEDKTMRLWTRSGTTHRIIKTGKLAVQSAAISPNNRFIVSCSTDGSVQLLDLETESVQELAKFDVQIRDLSFSGCGRYIETDRGVLDLDAFPLPFMSFPSSDTDSTDALFVTQSWLLSGMTNILWLPEEYSSTCVATSGSHIAIGHSSGAISFIRV